MNIQHARCSTINYIDVTYVNISKSKQKFNVQGNTIMWYACASGNKSPLTTVILIMMTLNWVWVYGLGKITITDCTMNQVENVDANNCNNNEQKRIRADGFYMTNVLLFWNGFLISWINNNPFPRIHKFYQFVKLIPNWNTVVNMFVFLQWTIDEIKCVLKIERVEDRWWQHINSRIRVTSK